MSGRAFLDTNVLVYAVDDADPHKRDRARQLLAEADPGDLVLSTQVLCEFYVVVTRKLDCPLPDGVAAEAVADLSQLPLIVATDAELVRAGIATCQRWQLSFWDGLIVAAATAAGCDLVLSEDLSDGARLGSVRIENPFAGTSSAG